MSQSVEAAVARIMAARYQPRVGDRVRYRANPECESYGGGANLALDGQLGTVVDFMAWGDGHDWGVRFDAHPDKRCWGAATELEPATADTASGQEDA